jgi:hypothetical protein
MAARILTEPVAERLPLRACGGAEDESRAVRPGVPEVVVVRPHTCDEARVPVGAGGNGRGFDDRAARGW